MNVLSLFDGMSCGRIALDRAGIKVDRYYRSEIDKYASIVAKTNYPDSIDLGDVTQWRSWDLPKIDLLIGGSPCQGFSFAGKQLNFDDSRSKLFFEFVAILKHYKPRYFLLENVMMKKEYQQVITDLLGVDPIMINSSLVSAQNRKRLYWTNIPNITQPEDKGILLKDIIETGVHSDKIPNFSYKSQSTSYFNLEGKMQSLCAGTHGYANGFIKCGRIVGRRINENGKRDDYNEALEHIQRFEPREDNKTGTLTTVQKDNVLQVLGYKRGSDRDGQRILSVKGKSGALKAGGEQNPISEDDITYRKLTPIECERLQTVPDNYTNHVSNTQRYKMLGNGWTVDVIAHIFKEIK